MRRSAILASSILGLIWICVSVAVAPAREIPKQMQKDPLYVEPPIVELQDGRSYRLDWCLNWGTKCGQEAADAYCNENGYSQAAEFEQDVDIGRETPTWVLGEQKVCDQDSCDGFKFITCVDK
jgi:hypothetical protein